MFYPPVVNRAGSAAGKDRDLGSDVRAHVRRLVDKAHFLIKGGFLELAAGWRPR